MTAGDIRDRCKTRFRDASGDVLDDSVWLGHINAAYHRFLADSEFPMELATTTLTFAAGDQSKALPTGVYAVRAAVNITTDEALEPIETWHEMARQGDRSTNTGDPTRYRVIGNNLHVFPTPTTETVISYVYPASSVDLAAGDSPIFPVRYHEALVDGGLEIAFADDEQMDRANYHGGKFQSRIDQAEREFLGARHEQYPALEDTFHRSARSW